MKYKAALRQKNTVPEEICTVRKRGGKEVIRVALAFPNTYYVGMSNLGFQTVYRLFHAQEGVVCERFFLPEDAQYGSTGSRAPLVSIETGRPLHSFHIIAFSLSFENDYPHILTMLDLGNVPLVQRDRTARDPLVIAGGIATFLNPEPLAEIFDLFLIGEAEELVSEFLNVVMEGCSKGRWRRPALSAFAGIKGAYVPSAYTVTYTAGGCIEAMHPKDGFPARIPCRHVSALDVFPAMSCFSIRTTEFGSMALLEVSRGCTRQCRFCAVGTVYRPYRSRSIAILQHELANVQEDDTRIGILGAAVADYPELNQLVHHIAATGRSASISSLRADALTEELIVLLLRCGHKTFTIAPEAGSERLRTVIGKRLLNEDIFRSVRLLAAAGVMNIKLYFMVGLPTETDQDVQDIVRLTKAIKHECLHQVKYEARLPHIQVSVSPFVPKPATPFQWHPFDDVDRIRQKLKYITNAFKKERTITVSHDLPKWAYLQAMFSRGDRRVGKLLMMAHEMRGDWNRVFRESDLNPDFYVYRQRSREECLPWDFIEHAIDKETLWKEYQKALCP
ncbi:MAG: radical SAM protein [Desulfobacterota bacterium]|nr:radical SAM protein [Thermodesulfobacteriota bacterium]